VGKDSVTEGNDAGKLEGKVTEGTETDRSVGKDMSGNEICGTEADCRETLGDTDRSVSCDGPTGSENRDERGRPVGSTLPVGNENSEGRERFASKELGNVTSDRSELSADASVGKEVIPALICDKMELSTGASDGRTTDGRGEAVALSSNSSELRADTPVGRYV